MDYVDLREMTWDDDGTPNPDFDLEDTREMRDDYEAQEDWCDIAYDMF